MRVNALYNQVSIHREKNVNTVKCGLCIGRWNNLRHGDQGVRVPYL